MKSKSKSLNAVFVNDWISTYHINDELYIFASKALEGNAALVTVLLTQRGD